MRVPFGIRKVLGFGTGVVRSCPVLDAVAGLAGAREVEVRKREGGSEKGGVLGASA
jgi:hypothetical protein